MNEIQRITLQVAATDAPLQLDIHGESDRYVSRQLRETGVWEPYETLLVQSLLGVGDTFLDVGANIGYFTVLAADRVGPDGQVFAFEPDRDNFALLCSSCNINGLAERVEAVQGALADTDGEAQLYLSRDNFGDHQIYAGVERRESYSIRLINGTDYLAPRLRRLRLVKVDTQGSEFLVFRGLMPLLSGLPEPADLLVELTPFSLREAGSSGRELVQLLAELGQPFWIVDHVEHQLHATSAVELARWSDNVEAVPGDRGFMNILVGPAAGLAN